MGLIDTDRLKAHYSWWGDTEERKMFDDIVDAQPTVDAVPVVRCKDCKWLKTNYMWNGRECKVCGIEPYGSIRELDDFCSRGERKEDE